MLRIGSCSIEWLVKNAKNRSELPSNTRFVHRPPEKIGKVETKRIISGGRRGSGRDMHTYSELRLHGLSIPMLISLESCLYREILAILPVESKRGNSKMEGVILWSLEASFRFYRFRIWWVITHVQHDLLHRCRGSADDLIPALRDCCELLDVIDFEVLDDEIVDVRVNCWEWIWLCRQEFDSLRPRCHFSAVELKSESNSWWLSVKTNLRVVCWG
jgi:hypothetical protein